MMEKLVQFVGLCVILVLIFLPLCIVVEEINDQTDMHYAEFTIDDA